MKRFVLGLTAVSATFATLLANAQAITPNSQVVATAVKFVGIKGNTLNYFQGPAGYTGVGVTTPSGRQMVLYITNDGSLLVSGAVIDAKTGDNLVQTAVKYLPEPNYDELVREAHKLKGVSIGRQDAKNVAYVLVDPRCPYCHKTYKGFQELQSTGADLRVEWIPVGILSPQSATEAKAVLGSSPAEAKASLDQLMTRKPFTPLAVNVSKGADIEKNNQKFMDQFGFGAVPVVIVKAGGKTTVESGLPDFAQIKNRLATGAAVAATMP